MNGFKNCFAYNNECYCEGLSEMFCKTKGKCPFYKTKEQHKEEIAKSNKRLIKLNLLGKY